MDKIEHSNFPSASICSHRSFSLFCLLGAGAFASAYFAKKIDKKFAILGASACSLTAVATAIIPKKTTEALSSQEAVIAKVKSDKGTKMLDLSSLPSSIDRTALFKAIIEAIPVGSQLEAIKWGNHPLPPSELSLSLPKAQRHALPNIIKLVPDNYSIVVHPSYLDKYYDQVMNAADSKKVKVIFDNFQMFQADSNQLRQLVEAQRTIKSLHLLGGTEHFDQEALNLIATSIKPTELRMVFGTGEAVKRRMGSLDWGIFEKEGYSIKYSPEITDEEAAQEVKSYTWEHIKNHPEEAIYLTQVYYCKKNPKIYCFFTIEKNF